MCWYDVSSGLLKQKLYLFLCKSALINDDVHNNMCLLTTLAEIMLILKLILTFHLIEQAAGSNLTVTSRRINIVILFVMTLIVDFSDW